MKPSPLYMLLLAVMLFSCESALESEAAGKEPVAENDCLKMVSPNGGETLRVGMVYKLSVVVEEQCRDDVKGTGVLLHLFQGENQILDNIQGGEQLELGDPEGTDTLWAGWEIPAEIFAKDENGAWKRGDDGQLLKIEMPTGKGFRILAVTYDHLGYDSHDRTDATFSIQN